jgi:hypothetical protein
MRNLLISLALAASLIFALPTVSTAFEPVSPDIAIEYIDEANEAYDVIMEFGFAIGIMESDDGPGELTDGLRLAIFYLDAGMNYAHRGEFEEADANLERVWEELGAIEEEIERFINSLPEVPDAVPQFENDTSPEL